MARVKIIDEGVTHKGDPVEIGAIISTSESNVDLLIAQGKGEAVGRKRQARLADPEEADDDAAGTQDDSGD